MSLTQEAIKHLQNDSVAIVSAQALMTNKTSRDAIVLPDNYKPVSIEQYQPRPNLFRAILSTNSISDFLSYLSKNGSADTQLFIDKTEMKAQAIIDMGAALKPEWGKHRANLTMLKTPEYQALLKHNEIRLDQQSLIDFLLDWQEHIVFFSDEKSIAFKDGLRQLRRLTVEKINRRNQEIGDLNSLTDTHSSVTVKTGTDAETVDQFEFTTAAYEGLSETKIQCCIRYYPDDKGLKISYRIISVNSLQEQFAQAFKELIAAGVNEKAPLFVGTMQYQ